MTHRERKEGFFLKKISIGVKKEFYLEINLVQQRRESRWEEIDRYSYKDGSRNI
jgi:hypothetical protein